MNEAWTALVYVSKRLVSLVATPSFAWSAAGLALVVLGAFALDVRAGRDWRRYLSRTFLTDVAYTVFYAAGFYYLFFSGPLDRLINDGVDRHASFLRLRLLEGMHPAAGWLVIIVLTDGINYWTHRWGHAYRWLWCFHCLHHSADRLTPLVRFRVHFGEMTFFGLVKALPLVMLGPPIVGLPVGPWLPLSLFPIFLQAVAHADMDWGYGWLGKVVVSPRFHRLHHSMDPAQAGTNFGQIFSFWDYLWGTADASRTRPLAYGTDLAIPESFLRQLFVPFLLLAKRLSPPQRTPATAASSTDEPLMR